jgi:ATP-dependent Lon protease
MSQQPLSEPLVKHRESNDVRALPVLPVRDTVLFPHAVLPLTVGRESSSSLSIRSERIRLSSSSRSAKRESTTPNPATFIPSALLRLFIKS